VSVAQTVGCLPKGGLPAWLLSICTKSSGRAFSGPGSRRWILKNLILAKVMLAGIVAPAFAQSAATNQTGDDGMHMKVHIDLRRFLRAVSVMRLLPTYNERVRERGT
jgi:hypothetical protein